jgi:hypothetical protein
VVGLPQHSDQHGPKGPVLLAVDQKLGEGPALRVAPELADPVGSVEVRQVVGQLGAGGGTEGVEALPWSALEFVGFLGLGIMPSPDDAVCSCLRPAGSNADTPNGGGPPARFGVKSP